MKIAVIPIAFLFGSCALAAQAASGGVSRGCPVSMRLDQAANSSLLFASPANRLLQTRLELNLFPVPHARVYPSSIKSAEVTVHGSDSNKPVVELVSPGGPGAPVERRLEVKFTSTADGEVASDFVVHGLASAGWLEIDSFNFENGTAWKPERGQACVVIPNMFRLVAPSAAER